MIGLMHDASQGFSFHIVGLAAVREL